MKKFTYKEFWDFIVKNKLDKSPDKIILCSSVNCANSSCSIRTHSYMLGNLIRYFRDYHGRPENSLGFKNVRIHGRKLMMDYPCSNSQVGGEGVPTIYCELNCSMQEQLNLFDKGGKNNVERIR